MIKNDVKTCGVCDWSMDNRRKGLRFLNSITYQAQQEGHLRELLANGTVPNAPKLWEGSAESENSNTATATAKWQGTLRASGTIKGFSNSYLSSSSRVNDNSEFASPTEIMLHWGPFKEDTVSFFSLEFAGLQRLFLYFFGEENSVSSYRFKSPGRVLLHFSRHNVLQSYNHILSEVSNPEVGRVHTFIP